MDWKVVVEVEALEAHGPAVQNQSKQTGVAKSHHHQAPMMEIFILGQTTNESCLKDLTLDSLAVWSWVQTFIESEEPRDGIKATDSSLDQHSRHIIKILLLIKQWVCQT